MIKRIMSLIISIVASVSIGAGAQTNYVRDNFQTLVPPEDEVITEELYNYTMEIIFDNAVKINANLYQYLESSNLVSHGFVGFAFRAKTSTTPRLRFKEGAAPLATLDLSQLASELSPRSLSILQYSVNIKSVIEGDFVSVTVDFIDSSRVNNIQAHEYNSIDSLDYYYLSNSSQADKIILTGASKVKYAFNLPEEFPCNFRLNFSSYQDDTKYKLRLNGAEVDVVNNHSSAAKLNAGLNMLEIVVEEGNAQLEKIEIVPHSTSAIVDLSTNLIRIYGNLANINQRQDITVMLVKKGNDSGVIDPSDIGHFEQTVTELSGEFKLQFKFDKNIFNYNIIINCAGVVTRLGHADFIYENASEETHLSLSEVDGNVSAVLSAGVDFLNEADDFQIIMAFFDAGGALIQTGVGNVYEFSYTQPIPNTAKKVRGFVWESLQSAKPYTKEDSLEIE